jgi:hypothetical protein
MLTRCLLVAFSPHNSDLAVATMPSLGDWLFGALKYAAIVPLVYVCKLESSSVQARPNVMLQCLVAPVYRRTLHPLSKFPGPLFASLTDLYAGYFVFRQDMHRQVLRNHEKYGPVVRHGPNRLVFNTISALKGISYLNDSAP